MPTKPTTAGDILIMPTASVCCQPVFEYPRKNKRDRNQRLLPFKLGRCCRNQQNADCTSFPSQTNRTLLFRWTLARHGHTGFSVQQSCGQYLNCYSAKAVVYKAKVNTFMWYWYWRDIINCNIFYTGEHLKKCKSQNIRFFKKKLDLPHGSPPLSPGVQRQI
jgi:hypothetical protein